jgi:hypothetical protein
MTSLKKQLSSIFPLKQLHSLLNYDKLIKCMNWKEALLL